MKIDKDTIVSLLRSQGEDRNASRAEKELPNEVDTDADKGLLEKFGIDVGDLVAKVTGGELGAKLKGGLGKFLG